MYREKIEPGLVDLLEPEGLVRNVNEYEVESPGVLRLDRRIPLRPFDRDALISAVRTDQDGNSTFPEYLDASWRAGVVRYDVDFAARTAAYYGCNGEEYIEAYPAVDPKSTTGA